MVRHIVVLLFVLMAVNCSLAADSEETAKPPAAAPKPSLTDAEKQAGWKLLFDGETTTGWRGLGMDGFPRQYWEVRDGHLHCLGGAKGNDLVTVDKHENFDLTFEWMVPKLKGNSGVKYRVQEIKGNGGAFGCEYQLMFDPGVDNKDATGSLYDVFPPTGKTLKPLGEFNTSRIRVQGNHVEHWLNGVKVLDYEFGSDAFNAAVAKSKFAKSDIWAKVPMGYIALQDHHDEIWFRNMKLRDLPDGK